MNDTTTPAPRRQSPPSRLQRGFHRTEQGSVQPTITGRVMPKAPAQESPEQPPDDDGLRALLQRYDAPKPRYTSYPTAPWFSTDFDRDAMLQRLADVDERVAVYVHVPFCERRCLFCGCNTVIKRDRSLGTAYINKVIAEIREVAPKLGDRRSLRQLALGGGTPTFVLNDDIARLLRTLREHFRFAPEAELSIEVDPRSVTERDLVGLCELGFSRFSFGVQDLDPAVMKAVGREQRATTVARCFQTVRHNGARSVNADLMYGLPKQTPKTMRETIGELIALAPDRIALFGYAHVPWLKPHQRGLERQGLPDAAQRVELHLLARELLLEAGYVAIGMDHFALPTDSLAKATKEGSLHRNFMGYTTGAGLDLLGFGVSAISHFQGAFMQNETDLGVYSAATQQKKLPWAKGLVQTADDRVRAQVIEALMCDRSVAYEGVEKAVNMGFWEYFADAKEALAPLQADGLVDVGEAGVRVTERGRLMMRHVASAFDGRELGKARYSRTS